MKLGKALSIERILQSQGFGSRKGCRALVEAGLVAVAGRPCRDPSASIVPAAGLVLTVEGVDWPWRDKLYLALNKPADVECSHQPQHHRSVFSLLPPHMVARGVQCAGRLDADTTGLLLLSDDGAWLHALAAPRRHVPKTYRVTTKHAVEPGLVAALLAGVQLRDEPTPVAALACEQVDSHLLSLTLDQGKYHQVKRMVAAAGNRVEALHRDAVGGIRLGEGGLADLAEGAWRELDADALALLTP